MTIRYLLGVTAFVSASISMAVWDQFETAATAICIIFAVSLFIHPVVLVFGIRKHVKWFLLVTAMMSVFSWICFNLVYPFRMSGSVLNTSGLAIACMLGFSVIFPVVDIILVDIFSVPKNLSNSKTDCHSG